MGTARPDAFDLGDHTALLVPRRRLIVEILEEPLDLGQRRPPHGPRQPMRDLFLEHRVRGQPDGVEVTCFFQSPIDRGDRIGRGRPKEAAAKVADSIAGDDGVEDVPPAVGAVDVTVEQGAAFQHAELVEQEVRVVACAVEVPVPSSTFLIAVRRADRAVHVQHDILQPVAVMKPVDPLPVQIGQRLPVLGQGKCLGLEPPHLGSRSCSRVDSSAADNLTHDRIECQPIGIVDILVSSQPPEHRLPEQAVKPVDRVLAPAIVAQRR